MTREQFARWRLSRYRMPVPAVNGGTISKSVRGFAFILFGMMVAVATNYGLKILIARKLGAEALGIFSLCYILLYLLNTAADFGIRQSFVTLVGKTTGAFARRNDAYWGWAVLLKIGGCGTVCLVGLLAAPWLAATVFHKGELTPYFRLTFLGIFVLGVWDFVEMALQARRGFARTAFLRMVIDFFRLSSFVGVVLWWRGAFSAFMLGYFLAPLASTAVALYLWPPRLPVGKAAGARDGLVTLINYGKWNFLTRILTMLLTMIDSILLAAYSTLAVVGIYEAAKGLAYGLLLMNESMGYVLLPRAAGLKSTEEFKSFIRRFVKCFAVLVVAAPLVLVAAPHFLALFGKEFVSPEVLLIIAILLPGCLAAIPTNFMSIVLLSRGKPAIPALVALAQVLVALIGYRFALPAAGVIGAATTNTLVQALGFVTLLGFFLREVPRIVRPVAKLHEPAGLDGSSGSPARHSSPPVPAEVPK